MGRDSYGVDINLTAAFHAGNEGMIPEKNITVLVPFPYSHPFPA